MLDRLETEAQDHRILQLQIDAIHKASPASFMSVVGAVLAANVYWSPETATVLIWWVCCIVAVAAVNVGSAIALGRGRPASWDVHDWRRFICTMHLLSGLTWGIGGGWMLSIANEQQALITLTIGLTAITMSITSVVDQRAYNMFQVPIFWSYAIGAAFSSLQHGPAITIGFFLLAPIAALIGKSLGGQLTEAMRLALENKALIDQLKERSEELEAANRELQIVSTTDPLTGVANRRRMMSFARAAQGSCAVIVVDVDHFKSYNDTYGHVEGDTCLVEIAETMQRCVRRDLDLVARLGGEEFAVVMTDITENAACEIAEAIRAGVEAIYGQHRSRVRRVVTVSVGVAVRGDNERRPVAELMEAADAAVYGAKKGGRNQVWGNEGPVIRAVA
ncbi:MAG: diguanylate cyclase [Mesorhizobium sp.]